MLFSASMAACSPCSPPLGTSRPGPEWVYEVEWDGLRVLAEVADGGLRLVIPQRPDVTPTSPSSPG